MVALHQRWAVERVAPFDARGVAGVQKHVHPRQRPSGPVHLLPIKGEVLGPHLLRCLNQKRARPACWITDRVTRFGGGKFREKARDGRGRIELARLLARIRGEARNQVDVAFADDVLVDPAGAEVHCRFREILKHILEAAVPVFRSTKVGFRVEVDVAKDPFELGAVRVFNPLKGDVDQFADICLVPLTMKVIEACALRQDETLTLQPAADAGFVFAVLLAVVDEMIVPEVRDVFQEQHHKDVVLVLPRIDDTPEGVASGPCGLVDLLLGNLVCHCGYPCCGASLARSLKMRLWN